MRKILYGNLIILIVSAVLIFFKFNLIPKNISYDELEFGQLALSLADKTYTPYSELAFGHSTLYFYIILLSFKIFGVNNFALRLPSAIFGILGAVMFYKLMWQIYAHKKNFLSLALPVLSSIILITSHWYLNFARFSFEATFLLFLELTSIYFVFKKKYIWAGVFAGLSFLSYTPGRIFFLLPLFALLLSNKNRLRNLLQFVIPFIIIVSSLITYLISHQDTRIQELFSYRFIGENLNRIFLMFVSHGDMNGRHNFPGKPALNPIFGLIFFLGFIQAWKNIHKFNNQFFMFYFFLSLIPAIFTLPQDNPNMLRTVTVLPSIAYFSTLPFIRIYNLRIKFRNVLILASIFLFLTSSFYELRTYFFFQSRVMKNSFEVKCGLDRVINYHFRNIPKDCRVNKNEF